MHTCIECYFSVKSVFCFQYTIGVLLCFGIIPVLSGQCYDEYLICVDISKADILKIRSFLCSHNKINAVCFPYKCIHPAY